MQMYKALHPEDDKIKEEDLKIVTLENILVNDLYNDLGFMVRNKLICLVEAQSTWTMNILIRVILYYAKTLKEYIDENYIDLYATVKADIPKPEFYVVYTGDSESRPKTINLSKDFFCGISTNLDVTVNMLYGDTDDIIGEYVTFSKVINEQFKTYGRTLTAVKETIKICKDKNILKTYLESREKEVIDMMVTLFDEEQIMKAHDKTIYNQALSQGISQGIISTIKTCKKYGGSRADAILQLVEDYDLDMQTAEERVDELW